jgi:hypothetical protein
MVPEGYVDEVVGAVNRVDVKFVLIDTLALGV